MSVPKVNGNLYQLNMCPFNVAKAISNVSYKKMFSRKEIRETELTGDAVVTGLLSIVLKDMFSRDPEYRKRIASVISDSRLRLIVHESQTDLAPDEDLADFDLDILDPYFKVKLAVDWISGMTDKYAVEEYQRLSGRAL